MSTSSQSPSNHSSEGSSVPSISKAGIASVSNASTQCPNKKRERSTSGTFVKCDCESLPETGLGHHIGLDDAAEVPSQEYASLLSKHADERTEEENILAESNMKQSPSSGALNELLPSEEKVDPSIGSVKSRRTCMTKNTVADTQENQIYDAISNHNACKSESNSDAVSLSEDSTSSYSSSSYTVDHSDESPPEVTTNTESIHESITQDSPNEQHGTLSLGQDPKSAIDISEAVNILRIDSTKDLKRLQKEEIEECSNKPTITPSKQFQEQSRKTPIESTCSQAKIDQVRTYIPDNYANINPEKLYASILISKGYKNLSGDSKSIFKSSSSLQDGFFATYSPDQIASYSEGSVVSAVRRQDVCALRSLHSEGMHMQCSNRFGESIIHLGCRLGSKSVVQFLLDEASVSLRVCDDFGRTPMHDACWMREPNFELMEILVQNDPDLLMIRDKRGFSPLSYVRHEHWCQWCEFLLRNKDYLYPREIV